MDQNTQSVSWDIGANINSATSQTRNVFSDLAGSGSTGVIESFGKYNIVGINANSIDDMRFAIRVYVENLEAHLNSVKQEAMDTSAFKGQYANSIVEYVNAVCDVVKSLTSQLLAFSDKLVEIKEKYQEQDINLTKSINMVTSNASAGINRYDEMK